MQTIAQSNTQQAYARLQDAQDNYRYAKDEYNTAKSYYDNGIIYDDSILKDAEDKLYIAKCHLDIATHDLKEVEKKSHVVTTIDLENARKRVIENEYEIVNLYRKLDIWLNRQDEAKQLLEKIELQLKQQ